TSGITVLFCATNRTSSALAARERQPTHVRTGPSEPSGATLSRRGTIASRSAGGGSVADGTGSLTVHVHHNVGFGVGTDVDPPTGESSRQAGVLSFLTDRQGLLVVGDDDAGHTGRQVHDLDRVDPGRGQGVG